MSAFRRNRDAQNHPQPQGKIELGHQVLKNRILLESHDLPGALEHAVAAFVEHHNHRRGHESLDNLTPVDIYFGRAGNIPGEWKKIKDETPKQRRLLNPRQAAWT